VDAANLICGPRFNYSQTACTVRISRLTMSGELV
jgi:hypothetical protein